MRTPRPVPWRPDLVLLILVGLLALSLLPSSCNFKFEVKQTPSSKEPK